MMEPKPGASQRFYDAVKAAGLIPLFHNEQHWKIIGGAYVVNYYPQAKGGPTFYVNGMGSGQRAQGLDGVIAAARKPKNRPKVRRKSTYTRVKRLLFRRSPLCRWCERQLTIEEATIDHAIPLSRGGSNGSDNLVLSCVECNRAKRSSLPTEFAPRKI